jgi:hypothetical protein
MRDIFRTASVLATVVFVGLFASDVAAQRGGRGTGPTATQPKVMQVCGPRDGTSFFNLVDYPETRRSAAATSTR